NNDARSAPTRSQVQLPRLGDQILPEAVVLLAVHDAEACRLVQSAGGDELALGPEHHLAVARLTGKPHALAHQAGTEARPTRLRLHQQQAQLGHGLRSFDEEPRAYHLAV